MIDVQQLLADVQAAASEVGRLVSVTDYVDSYSPTTGKTTRTATTYSVLASPPYGQTRAFGTDSQPAGSAQIVVPAQGVTFTLRPGQKVETGGKAYTITVVGRLEVVDTLVAYELTLQEGAP